LSSVTSLPATYIHGTLTPSAHQVARHYRNGPTVSLRLTLFRQLICPILHLPFSNIRNVASPDKQPLSIPEQLENNKFCQGNGKTNYMRRAEIISLQVFVMAPANARKSSSTLPEGTFFPSTRPRFSGNTNDGLTHTRIPRGQHKRSNATIRRLPTPFAGPNPRRNLQAIPQIRPPAVEQRRV